MTEAQQNILDHYKNPQNAGKPSWVPTNTAKVQNLTCGDEVTIYLLVENGIIKDYRFEGEGCSISIASASMLSEKIIGQTIESVTNLTELDTEKMIGIELSLTRKKCNFLPLEAIHKALIVVDN